MDVDRRMNNVVTFVIVIGLIYSVKCHEDFDSPQTKTESWLNPDLMFAPTHPIKEEKKIVSKDLESCQENLKACTEKNSECEILFRSSEGKPITCPECNPCPGEVDGAKVYLQRFIHLLLDASNLNDQNLEPVNNAEFSFYISDEQLLTLRQFAREGNVKLVPLRKVDEVFAAIFVKPYFKIPKLTNLVDMMPDVQVGSFYITVFLPSVWFFSVLFLTKNIRKTFIWFMPMIFLTTFITTARQMFEESEQINYNKIKQNKDLPTSCHSLGLSGLFRSYPAECSTYLKNHNIDPNLGITTVKILTRMFGEVMADFMKFFGTGTVNLFSSLEELSFLSQLWIGPFAIVLFVAVLIILMLVITGGSIKLPWFLGGGVTFSNPNKHHNVQGGRNEGNVLSSGSLEITSPQPTNNFTFNISGPTNVHDILRSLSQGAHQPDPAQILPQITSSVVDDLAAGDGPSQGFRSHPVSGTSHRSHRPVVSTCSKKNRQFSHLNARYKAGTKSSGKLVTRARPVV